MRQAIFTVALLLGAAMCSPAAAKDDLPRKPALGIQLEPAAEGQGVAVVTVFPAGTAAKLGIRTGDILTAVNGTKVRNPGEVIALTQTLTSGKPVAVELLRGGNTLKLQGEAQAKPFEEYAGANVDYGSVAFGDGRLRDVLVMPAGAADAPVVYFIQGFSCGSIEGGPRDGLYYRLGEELIKRGIGYYRVEKVAQGDSSGTLRCQDVDFATETEGFRTAYRELINERKVAPERIFMFGHSLGGLTAPLLAAETAPRGIAVFGTVVRNWADYDLERGLTQNFLIGGADPVETARSGEGRRDLIRMFYFQKMEPAAIAKARPDYADALRNEFGWDGDKVVLGRNYLFAQQLASVPLLEAWKKSKTNVLSIYGASDMIALTDVDHRYLADIANYWRPGSGRYVEIADTDHGMFLVGSREAIRQAYRSGSEPPSGPFNDKVVEELAAWIRASMAKPPLTN